MNINDLSLVFSGITREALIAHIEEQALKGINVKHEPARWVSGTKKCVTMAVTSGHIVIVDGIMHLGPEVENERDNERARIEACEARFEAGDRSRDTVWGLIEAGKLVAVKPEDVKPAKK